MATLHATFQDGARAREAQRKLQFLRIEQIDQGADGASLTADVGDELMDRALHVIRQTGGTADNDE
ncbi:hypothetical protein GXP70_10180 [Paenibacillus lycopersici]|uniref:Uncharacterized protein n=1 Tax=Paenibacillus lycopersici TaxID=2704462 RepID=A0A6C0FYE0_9BACL|nr:hypothetical protein [Paenibacillus lycopersici]QHT60274.1 hypothetical protein GXP70_10180 [Paenibacillus lycopersici]